MTDDERSALPPSNARRAAFGWLALCLILLVALALMLPRARLNSSVLAMLPAQSLGAIPPALSDGFIQRLDGQLVWMVSPGKTADPSVAERWQTLLTGSGTPERSQRPDGCPKPAGLGHLFLSGTVTA